MASVLVVYATSHGQTALIARNLAAHMRTQGVEVVVFDVKAIPPAVDVSAYDAVVLGGRVHGSRHPRALLHFVRANLPKLHAMRAAFFSVSGVMSRPNDAGRKEAEEIVAKFLADAAWTPAITATFAGAIKYTKYNFFLRWVMKRIAKAEGGSTDTSCDHEYTDWNAVRRFGDTIAAAVKPALRRPLDVAGAHSHA
jgi:menaquinone-dependent protoporphyrinogen oxidase